MAEARQESEKVVPTRAWTRLPFIVQSRIVLVRQDDHDGQRTMTDGFFLCLFFGRSVVEVSQFGFFFLLFLSREFVRFSKIYGVYI